MYAEEESGVELGSSHLRLPLLCSKMEHFRKKERGKAARCGDAFHYCPTPGGSEPALTMGLIGSCMSVPRDIFSVEVTPRNVYKNLQGDCYLQFIIG